MGRAAYKGYDSFYRAFDSPLMRRVRREAYGEDIGQHSWVTADDLRKDISRLALSTASRLLDLGCGPCGPLTFVVGSARCLATGVDMSAQALALGERLVASLGLGAWVTLQEADLNEPLPLATRSFNAIMALDVIIHVRDRARLFGEVARMLVPGGRFLLTDAGVVTGSISTEEVQLRSMHGDTQFTGRGFNERTLEDSGFRLLEVEDRTASLIRNAGGRLAARSDHQAELEELEGAGDFKRQQQYLKTVIDLSRRGSVSRTMYLAESPGA